MNGRPRRCGKCWRPMPIESGTPPRQDAARPRSGKACGAHEPRRPSAEPHRPPGPAPAGPHDGQFDHRRRAGPWRLPRTGRRESSEGCSFRGERPCPLNEEPFSAPSGVPIGKAIRRRQIAFRPPTTVVAETAFDSDVPSPASARGFGRVKALPGTAAPSRCAYVGSAHRPACSPVPPPDVRSRRSSPLRLKRTTASPRLTGACVFFLSRRRPSRSDRYDLDRGRSSPHATPPHHGSHSG